MKIYSVLDKVSGKFLNTSVAESDAEFIRGNLLQILMDYPIRDVQLYHVGYFDEKTGKIRSRLHKRPVSWDSYKIPESFAKVDSKDISLEKFDEFAKAQKAAFTEVMSKPEVKDE